MEENEKSSRSGIQVIARAAAVLRALKTEQSGMSLGQIADVVGLPRSTVQRIVGALQAERLVISEPNGRGLRLGPEVSALAEATRYNIVETCRLLLMELTQATGETADLSVMRGAGMIFLDQVPGTHRLRTVSSVGEVFPLTTTANGKACLSMVAPEKAEQLIRDEWDRRGIDGDLPRFMATLDMVRDTGLAFDLDQHTPGISAIGFAFRDFAGDIHAISVPVPTTRFEAIRPNVEAALLKTSTHIAKLMSQD
ncbi:MAG: IclR family transcriptional regulator [Silicimonas sp.]|nr:IclR family transcriptional regulator [Silicimonas sp.]